MAMQNCVGSEFTRAFEYIDNELVFNAAWVEGYNGYWNGAVKGDLAPLLSEGSVAKTTSGNGRRAIIIGSHYGNIILFDRYVPTDGEPDGQINYQVPRDEVLIWLFGGAGACDETKLFQFLSPTDPTENIGSTLANARIGTAR